MSQQLLMFDIPGVSNRLITSTWMLQRSYNWQLMMTRTIGGISGPFVSQYCQDVSLGNYKISDLSTVRYGAFKRHYASLMSIETVTLTFLAPVDNSVYDYFKEWRNLVVDEQGFYYPKANYAKRIFVSLYNKTGIQTLMLVLNGTFPLGLPKVAASYSSEDVLKYEIELSVDYIKSESLTGKIREGITNAGNDIVDSFRSTP